MTMMTPDIAPDPSRTFSVELLLMLLADARLPSGGHTQSGGLEPALRAGLTLDEVPDYLSARLVTVVPIAAGAAVLVARAATQPAWIVRIWREWEARTPSPALRQVEQRLGRGYLRLVERLWGYTATAAMWEAARTIAGSGAALPTPPRPIVIGVLAGLVGLAPEQTARLIGYDDVQTVVAACLKLEPLDPADATGWTLARFPQVDAMARQVASLVEPGDMPAAGAPQIDQWAEAHTEMKARLFNA